MNNIESIMKAQLDLRTEQLNIRTLESHDGFTDFFSNDYLSLVEIPTPLHIIDKPGSSRLISGTTPLFLKLEKKCAEFFDDEAALAFNSGYDANIGVFSSIPQRGDMILYDESSHASMIDGMRLSLARRRSFKHNDLADLERKLHQQSSNNCFVAVEGLYSMDGDLAPLKEMQKLCDEYGAFLIVDEAHSGGVYGPEGKGYAKAQGIHPFLRIFTFGKAFSSHGACVIGSQITKDYLTNFARSFIYTTALSEFTVARTLHILENADFNKQQTLLQKNINHFNKIFSSFILTSDERSPIKILRLKDRKEIRAVEKELHNQRFGTVAVFSPAVPKEKECLRFSIHSYNSIEEIDKLYAVIQGSLQAENKPKALEIKL
ncbi:pyridoxal phosphate-dependent aminotransferase family protein [Brumimicrobium glaciale]|uniref:Pyridoxal phosphate-dependent aminotransferase family protein n=1 Tax=Brumimicrobium glaciale TaxID=200475 RepID=A0A4V1WET1_9FLAO|nr:pyridoxal phosphate-dependent aminotransferase family protein [Brumimicrobium glaciale]RYM30776.1 pyridoxal phosphate-dependent aminotransferase family protein [Brumimicrobium glaciale]